MGIAFKPLSCFTIQDSSRGYDSYERRKLYILQYILDTSHYIEKPWGAGLGVCMSLV